MLIIKIKDCKIPVEGGAISSFGWPLFYFKYCVSSLWLLLFYVIVFRVIFLLFVFGGRLFMNRKTCRFHIYLLPPFRCFLQKLKYVTIKLNLNFKLLSLNVRGIRSIEKRKAIFSWSVKSKSDIRFLTYSTLEGELAWKSQWRGDVLFSHGSEHSRGVMILVKENFDCELTVCHIDSDGRFMILRSQMQDHPFVLINIYAPNRANDQCTFFEEIRMI